MTDRVWSEINAQPAKPCRWGAALPSERIIKPALITEQPKMFTRPEIRKLIDGEDQ